ncbi:MAG: adenylate/guanylate cyclase domain-containing protein [Piscinibacter sp.]|uniref:CHASE2 domain-containing protein n=1 Tax=Piscinibacter sp. TaxID=1903157 RepID=UPI00258937E4|nr:adenylate/guanylate cyclase domain-containing protein [Piscinibacter sp.]MCW5665110.1 adenylate/guanylate cyclase domain-containing protein [Piscinibacter sp.]
MGARGWRFVRAALVAALFLLLLGHAADVLPWRALTQLDQAIDDARLRAAMPRVPHERIVIVDVDEASLARLGRWPWPRARMATLADELFERQRAAVVGFDIVFTEPDADDARFADALSGRRVVLGFYLSNAAESGRVGRLPEPAFDAALLRGQPGSFTRWRAYAGNVATVAQAAPQAGFINTLPDADGNLRRMPLIAALDGRHYETLALAMYRSYTGGPAVEPVFPPPRPLRSPYPGLSALMLVQGETRDAIPVDAQTMLRVPYRSPGGPRAGGFAYLSAADLVEGRVAPGSLAGKLVLVGTTAPGLYDLRSTPVSQVFPGVEVHANLLARLLDGRGPLVPDWAAGFEEAQLLVVLALLVLLLPRLSALRGIVATALLLAALVGLNVWAYQARQWLLPLASGLTLALLLSVLHIGWGYVTEARTRRSLTRLFGTYVPPELVEQMARDPQRYTMQAENRVLTIMFCDMRNFTRVSEALPPEELRALINRFFSAMTMAIRARRGTLDKYIGDAIMAFWGAPVADERHAANAVAAALAMVEVLGELNQSLHARGLPEIGVGIGLNTGLVCVGDMGSDIRRSYTVMGDAVNLASRIEALTRHYGVDILVGEATAAAAGAELGFVEVDRVRVKGKEAAVTLFTPVPEALARNASFDEEMRLWRLALAAYRAQDAPQAQAALQELRTRFAASPWRGLHERLGERVVRWAHEPPPPGWDGTHTFDSK